MQKFISNCTEDTIELGETLAKTLKGGTVIAFYGGLGMGKTAFTRGMARALGVAEEVSSPNFAIVNDYGGSPPLYHFDMYRIELSIPTTFVIIESIVPAPTFPLIPPSWAVHCTVT